MDASEECGNNDGHDADPIESMAIDWWCVKRWNPDSILFDYLAFAEVPEPECKQVHRREWINPQKYAGKDLRPFWCISSIYFQKSAKYELTFGVRVRNIGVFMGCHE